MQFKDYENRIHIIIANQQNATILSIQQAYEQIYNKFLSSSLANAFVNNLIKRHKVNKTVINHIPYYHIA